MTDLLTATATASTEMFPCFGIIKLGMCMYNPNMPQINYFSLGDALAACGLIIAIQQILRPILLFRLQAKKIKISYLYVIIFIGALASIIASSLPNIPFVSRGFLAYPVVWEIIGSVFIISAFLITSILILRPAKITKNTALPFIRSAVHLLSKANERDQIDFAIDLQNNIEALINFTKEFERAEWASTQIIFDKLKEKNLPLQITGRVPISAFYSFTHRKELELASYAGTLLQVLSDPDFCATLVKRCPWSLAQILRTLSEKKLHSPSFTPFVHEITRQALILDDGMVSKEMTYKGFSAIPLLSQMLFSDPYILETYNPLANHDLDSETALTEGYLRRLCKAAEMMVDVALEQGNFEYTYYIMSLSKAYERVFDSIRGGIKNEIELSPGAHAQLTLGLSQIFERVSKALEDMNSKSRIYCFNCYPKNFRSEFTYNISSIFNKCLEGIANKFEGHNSEYWSLAIGIFSEIFPSYQNDAGLNPLQQQIALKMMNKVEENFNGWYPLVTRVLLSVVGSYQSRGTANPESAYSLLKTALYAKFQEYPLLYINEPEIAQRLLPTNVRYESDTKTLVHVDAAKNESRTQLDKLGLAIVDFTDTKYFKLDDAEKAKIEAEQARLRNAP
jgi:hypothetical protein